MYNFTHVWLVTGTTDLATSSPILWRPKLRSRILKRSGAAEARGRREYRRRKMFMAPG